MMLTQKVPRPQSSLQEAFFACGNPHTPTTTLDSCSAVGEPAKLVVVTATGYAFERTDGVAVVPITTLGP